MGEGEQLREKAGDGRGERGDGCLCVKERVKNERGEREIERVGNGRGMERERERDSRRWEGERGGMEAFKRDRVGDGRE